MVTATIVSRRPMPIVGISLELRDIALPLKQSLHQLSHLHLLDTHRLDLCIFGGQQLL